MKDQIGKPDIPYEENKENVRYYVLNKLSYPQRGILYLLLIAAGFLLQVLLMKVWPGAILLIFATVVNQARPLDTGVNLKYFVPDKSWTQVKMEQIRKIEEVNRKLSKWEKDLLDVTNSIGMPVFVVLAFGLFFAYQVLGNISSFGVVVKILVIDTVVLLLPLWFSGRKKNFRQDELSIKAGLIIKLEEFFQTIKKEGEHFTPELVLARDKDGKSVPKDCRFTIKMDKTPVGFYGVQAQININTVEGKNYPYFYCVIAAKAGFGLDRYFKQIQAPKNITVEYENDANADVIVIRQFTTKTSGYYTKQNTCMTILDIALNASRMIVEQSVD